MSASSQTRWAERAAALYTEAYAEAYRANDETTGERGASAYLGGWLRAIADGFGRPIDVLDLGCGTGRYFRSVAHARRVVGIDISAPMLERAARPVGVDRVPAGWLSLVHGDFLVHEFGDGEFDLVYAIGVLAEHSPFDERVAERVNRWLKPGGVFAFSAVHPLSRSVPRTIKRRVGESLLSFPSVAVRRLVRGRLMRDGLYADEERIQAVLMISGFRIESIAPFESDAHHHVLTVARKPLHR